MKIIACAPSEDQFWICMTEEEYLRDRERYHITPAMADHESSVEQARNPGWLGKIREFYETDRIEPEDVIFVAAARDLSQVEIYFALYPFAGQWNGYSPWRRADIREIGSLDELKDLPMTYRGRTYNETGELK